MHKVIAFSRFALFVVYFWFGLLKVLGLSPASPLVLSLLGKTMPFMEPHAFLILFGILEVIIGLLFLIPRTEKLALCLLTLHMIAVSLPLILLPQITWQKLFVPTLEGQYIIKNILIIAIAFTLAVHRRR